MNLFINTISNQAHIIIFDDNRDIIDDISWEAKWNESSTLIPQIDLILKNNKLKYNDLNNIVVVNGPWSFTWIRTTVLAANSINFIINKKMSAISYFELFNSYPIIKSSSKRDCFVKWDSNSKIEIIENEKLINNILDKNINEIYWDAGLISNVDLKIFDKIDYTNIIKSLKFDNLEQIDALYIKKPNIS